MRIVQCHLDLRVFASFRTAVVVCQVNWKVSLPLVVSDLSKPPRKAVCQLILPKYAPADRAVLLFFAITKKFLTSTFGTHQDACALVLTDRT